MGQDWGWRSARDGGKPNRSAIDGVNACIPAAEKADDLLCLEIHDYASLHLFDKVENVVLHRACAGECERGLRHRRRNHQRHGAAVIIAFIGNPPPCNGYVLSTR